MSIETQTEAFMDRPPSPLFVPAKSGVDADTQVIVGELFNFDLEVIPQDEQIESLGFQYLCSAVADWNGTLPAFCRQAGNKQVLGSWQIP